MKNTKRVLLLAAAALLLVAVSVGGTLAWLTDTTSALENTFLESVIDIDLTETKGGGKKEFKMVPGADIDKDPKVTVTADSEACWVFVKVEESTNLDDFISYEIASGWTELTAGSGVYYRAVSASASAQVFSVLKDDAVTVGTDVTKDMMEALKVQGAVQPTLTFTAYAIQQLGFTSPGDAWDEISSGT